MASSSAPKPAATAATAPAAVAADSKKESSLTLASAAALSDISFNFKGKLALVTGSTLGIGYAIAAGYVRSGASVVVNGRDQKVVDATVQKLTPLLSDAKGGQKIFGVAGDVGTAAGCKKLVADVEKLGAGPVEFLINNVSIFAAKDFFDNTDDEWENYFQINVMSAVRLSRVYLQSMLKRNSGRIVIISSECGFCPIPTMIPYSFSKGAQINIARGLAELTHGTKVTVNSLLPGPTATEGVESYLAGRLPLENAALAKAGKPPMTLDQFRDAYCKQTEPTSILERFVVPEEVANATLFLCTAGAVAINGSAQRVEGGIVRHL